MEKVGFYHYNATGKQAKEKSSYLEGTIMLSGINCDITKDVTNVTVDFSSFIQKKW